MYLITYDIREEKRLRKAALVLKKYGKRVQKSVFECEINEKKHEQLWNDLSAFCNGDDHILSYFLPASFRKKELNRKKL